MSGQSQSKISDIPSKFWPVIVVGAGPAGAVCARMLALAGHDVLVVERHGFPRHKTCGDQLISDSLKVLTELGLLERVRQEAIVLEGIQVFSPSQINYLVRGSFLGIRRHDFDDILMQAALEAGATFVEGHVTDVQPVSANEVRVRVRGLDKSLHARTCVLATGASVNLADKLGLIEHRQPSAVAIRFYVESPYELEHSVLSYDRSLSPGYAWIFPVARDLFNIGCGIRMGASQSGPNALRPMLDRFLREFPIGSRLIERRWYNSKISGAPIRCGLYGSRGFSKGNVLCAGEVIGTTYPFTGEGIGKAMRTGMMAGEVIAESLKAGDPELLSKYDDRIESEIRPLYQGYLAAEKWLANPRLNDFVARRVRRSRYLQDELESFVAETGDPSRLFSWSSLLKSYVK